MKSVKKFATIQNVADFKTNLLTVQEAADLRAVTNKAIYHLIKRRKLTPIIFAGRIVLDRDEVLNFIPDKGGRPAEKADNTSVNRSGAVPDKGCAAFIFTGAGFEKPETSNPIRAGSLQHFS